MSTQTSTAPDYTSMDVKPEAVTWRNAGVAMEEATVDGFTLTVGWYGTWEWKLIEGKSILATGTASTPDSAKADALECLSAFAG